MEGISQDLMMADQCGTHLINLAAIQRVDPTITTIIDNSTQTALYHYDGSSTEWEKTEIEGTFFVYKRKQTPHFGFIILNRLNTTNRVEPITDISETSLQVPYLMYQCKSGDIYGIWFYDKDDCFRISQKIASLVHVSGTMRNRRQRCVSESDSLSPMKISNGMPGSKSDIISILANAQMEFNQRSSASTALRHVPPLQCDANNHISASYSDKLATDKEIQPSLNGSSLKSYAQGVSSLSLSLPARKRFPSSGTSNARSSCCKQLFEEPSHESSSLTGAQEPPSPFGRSRGLSLDTTPRKLILHELLGESSDSDVENNSKLHKLVSNNFTSSSCQIPEEKSPDAMTPAMFEHTAKSSFPLKEQSCFEKSDDVHHLSKFLNGLHWKDDSTPGNHKLLSPHQPNCAPSQSVYSPLGFQNTAGDLGPYVSTCNDSIRPEDCAPLCFDSQSVSKEQLASSLIYILANDSGVLSKIHEAYISSLKTHLNISKK